MSAKYEHLKQRTKEFAIRIIRLVDALPTTTAGRRLGDQLLRAATSVGANYRSACRARSRNDFVSKLGIVEEEADESAYWLELITDAGLMVGKKTLALREEAMELVAIISASWMTARRNASTKTAA